MAERVTDLPYETWWYDFFSRPAVYVASIEKARRHFDLKTTPIADWIGETVRWYMANPTPDSTGYEHRDVEVALCKRWRDEYGAFEKAFIA